MANLPDVERLISGKGVIRIPEEYRKARNVKLYCDLIRPPTSEYLNVLWNPSQSFYAHICFCIDNYVLSYADMRFKAQVLEVFSGQPSQNLQSMICMAENILDSFVQYAIASGFVYTKVNGIFNHGRETFQPDNIKFYCYTDCALRLVLKGTELDICDEEEGDGEPPPPPPPPPDTVPPGTPLELSPPYDGDNDDGDTVPNPIDETPPVPPTEACQAYNVTYSYTATSDGSPPSRVENQTINLWGEIGGIRAGRDANGDPQILIECQDLADFQPCGTFQEYGVTTLIGGGINVAFSDPSIDSIT